jgi:hypothetical protein
MLATREAGEYSDDSTTKVIRKLTKKNLLAGDGKSPSKRKNPSPVSAPLTDQIDLIQKMLTQQSEILDKQNKMQAQWTSMESKQDKMQ